MLASTLEPALNSGTAAIDESRREQSLHNLRERNFSIVLDALQRAGLTPGARILEVGCGHGWFLKAASARGYRVTGIEPDAYIAAKARQNCPDLRVGLFPQVLRPDDVFDAFVFNDVLEHLPNVDSVLNAVRQHSARGGLLAVNLPLATGTFYRIANMLDQAGISGPFDRMWQKDFPSPHLYYFTADHLRSVAERQGFREVERRTLPSLELKGLWERLAYDRSSRFFIRLLMWPCLATLVPLLRLLPQDIGLQIFRAGPHDVERADA